MPSVTISDWQYFLQKVFKLRKLREKTDSTKKMGEIGLDIEGTNSGT